MLLHFYKMNGAGNDFIVIDNRDLSISLDEDTIAALCDRHRGIGADGLIRVVKSANLPEGKAILTEEPNAIWFMDYYNADGSTAEMCGNGLLAVEPAEKGADYKFRYYNADGGEAEMCGNGARCFGFFTAHLGDEDEELPSSVSFETIAGTLTAEIVGEEVRIAMSEPKDLQLNTPAKVDGFSGVIHSLNTGVPHAVSFVDDLENTDVFNVGFAVRHHSHFAPKGTNANFAKVLAPDHIAIRTYERGVEDETLACGTGMVACALIHHLVNGAESPIKVDVEGGDTLTIGFEKSGDQTFKNVTLTGPADFVIEGEIEI